MAYISIDTVKAALSLTGDDYDAMLTQIVEQASEIVSQMCRRTPGEFEVTTATARYLDSMGGTTELWIPEIVGEPDLVEIDPFAAGAWQTVPATDYAVWPQRTSEPNTRLDLLPVNTIYAWPVGRRTVRITAHWGYSETVPGAVMQATQALSETLFLRHQQGWTDEGAHGPFALSRHKWEDPLVGLMLARVIKRSL